MLVVWLGLARRGGLLDPVQHGLGVLGEHVAGVRAGGAAQGNCRGEDHVAQLAHDGGQRSGGLAGVLVAVCD